MDARKANGLYVPLKNTARKSVPGTFNRYYLDSLPQTVLLPDIMETSHKDGKLPHIFPERCQKDYDMDVQMETREERKENNQNGKSANEKCSVEKIVKGKDLAVIISKSTELVKSSSVSVVVTGQHVGNNSGSVSTVSTVRDSVRADKENQQTQNQQLRHTSALPARLKIKERGNVLKNTATKSQSDKFGTQDNFCGVHIGKSPIVQLEKLKTGLKNSSAHGLESGIHVNSGLSKTGNETSDNDLHVSNHDKKTMNNLPSSGLHGNVSCGEQKQWDVSSMSTENLKSSGVHKFKDKDFLVSDPLHDTTEKKNSKGSKEMSKTGIALLDRVGVMKTKHRQKDEKAKRKKNTCESGKHIDSYDSFPDAKRKKQYSEREKENISSGCSVSSGKKGDKNIKSAVVQTSEKTKESGKIILNGASLVIEKDNHSWTKSHKRETNSLKKGTCKHKLESSGQHNIGFSSSRSSAGASVQEKPNKGKKHSDHGRHKSANNKNRDCETAEMNEQQARFERQNFGETTKTIKRKIDVKESLSEQKNRFNGSGAKRKKQMMESPSHKDDKCLTGSVVRKADVPTQEHDTHKRNFKSSKEMNKGHVVKHKSATELLNNKEQALKTNGASSSKLKKESTIHNKISIEKKRQKHLSESSMRRAESQEMSSENPTENMSKKESYSSVNTKPIKQKRESKCWETASQPAAKIDITKRKKHLSAPHTKKPEPPSIFKQKNHTCSTEDTSREKRLNHSKESQDIQGTKTINHRSEGSHEERAKRAEKQGRQSTGETGDKRIDHESESQDEPGTKANDHRSESHGRPKTTTINPRSESKDMPKTTTINPRSESKDMPGTKRIDHRSESKDMPRTKRINHGNDSRGNPGTERTDHRSESQDVTGTKRIHHRTESQDKPGTKSVGQRSESQDANAGTMCSSQGACESQYSSKCMTETDSTELTSLNGCTDIVKEKGNPMLANQTPSFFENDVNSKTNLDDRQLVADARMARTGKSEGSFISVVESCRKENYVNLDKKSVCRDVISTPSRQSKVQRDKSRLSHSSGECDRLNETQDGFVSNNSELTKSLKARDNDRLVSKKNSSRKVNSSNKSSSEVKSGQPIENEKLREKVHVWQEQDKVTCLEQMNLHETDEQPSENGLTVPCDKHGICDTSLPPDSIWDDLITCSKQKDQKDQGETPEICSAAHRNEVSKRKNESGGSVMKLSRSISLDNEVRRKARERRTGSADGPKSPPTLRDKMKKKYSAFCGIHNQNVKQAIHLTRHIPLDDRLYDSLDESSPGSPGRLLIVTDEECDDNLSDKQEDAKDSELNAVQKSHVSKAREQQSLAELTEISFSVNCRLEDGEQSVISPSPKKNGPSIGSTPSELDIERAQQDSRMSQAGVLVEPSGDQDKVQQPKVRQPEPLNLFERLLSEGFPDEYAKQLEEHKLQSCNSPRTRVVISPETSRGPTGNQGDLSGNTVHQKRENVLKEMRQCKFINGKSLTDEVGNSLNKTVNSSQEKEVLPGLQASVSSDMNTSSDTSEESVVDKGGSLGEVSFRQLGGCSESTAPMDKGCNDVECSKTHGLSSYSSHGNVLPSEDLIPSEDNGNSFSRNNITVEKGTIAGESSNDVSSFTKEDLTNNDGNDDYETCGGQNRPVDICESYDSSQTQDSSSSAGAKAMASSSPETDSSTVREFTVGTVSNGVEDSGNVLHRTRFGKQDESTTVELQAYTDSSGRQDSEEINQDRTREMSAGIMSIGDHFNLSAEPDIRPGGRTVNHVIGNQPKHQTPPASKSRCWHQPQTEEPRLENYQRSTPEDSCLSKQISEQGVDFHGELESDQKRSDVNRQRDSTNILAGRGSNLAEETNHGSGLTYPNRQHAQEEAEDVNYRDRLKRTCIPVTHCKITTKGTRVTSSGVVWPQLFFVSGNRCICCITCRQWMNPLDFLLHYDMLPRGVEIQPLVSLSRHEIQPSGELSKEQRLLWDQFCHDLKNAKECWTVNKEPEPPEAWHIAQAQAKQALHVVSEATSGYVQAAVSDQQPPRECGDDPTIRRADLLLEGNIDQFSIEHLQNMSCVRGSGITPQHETSVRQGLVPHGPVPSQNLVSSMRPGTLHQRQASGTVFPGGSELRERVPAINGQDAGENKSDTLAPVVGIDSTPLYQQPPPGFNPIAQRHIPVQARDHCPARQKAMSVSGHSSAVWPNPTLSGLNYAPSFQNLQLPLQNPDIPLQNLPLSCQNPGIPSENCTLSRWNRIALSRNYVKEHNTTRLGKNHTASLPRQQHHSTPLRNQTSIGFERATQNNSSVHPSAEYAQIPAMLHSGTNSTALGPSHSSSLENNTPSAVYQNPSVQNDNLVPENYALCGVNLSMGENEMPAGQSTEVHRVMSRQNSASSLLSRTSGARRIQNSPIRNSVSVQQNYLLESPTSSIQNSTSSVQKSTTTIHIPTSAIQNEMGAAKNVIDQTRRLAQKSGTVFCTQSVGPRRRNLSGDSVMLSSPPNLTRIHRQLSGQNSGQMPQNKTLAVRNRSSSAESVMMNNHSAVNPTVRGHNQWSTNQKPNSSCLAAIPQLLVDESGGEATVADVPDLNSTDIVSGSTGEERRRGLPSRESDGGLLTSPLLPNSEDATDDGNDTLRILTWSQRCHNRILRSLCTERNTQKEEIRKLKLQLLDEIREKTELQSSVTSLVAEVKRLKRHIEEISQSDLPLDFSTRHLTT